MELTTTHKLKRLLEHLPPRECVSGRQESLWHLQVPGKQVAFQPVLGHVANALDCLRAEAELDHVQITWIGVILHKRLITEAKHLAGEKVACRQRQAVARVLRIA